MTTGEMRMTTSGWVYFAATIFIVVGILDAFYGLVAIFNSDWVVFTSDSIVLLDLTAWGWIMLITGIIAILVGFGALYGQTWARVVGIIVAALARLNPIAVVPVAVLLGALSNAGPSLQSIGVPPATVTMLQGAILVFAVAGEFFIANKVRRPEKMPSAPASAEEVAA